MIMSDYTIYGEGAFHPDKTAPPPPGKDGDDGTDHASESIALIDLTTQAAITTSIQATIVMSISHISHASTLSTLSKPATSTLVDTKIVTSVWRL